MLIKVFSLPFDSVRGDFDDGTMRDFLKDKELVSAQDYLFLKNEVPYLVFVLKYFPYKSEAENASVPKEKRDEDWKALLSEHDIGLFNLLRDWRSQRCKKEGVPPYVLFTNRQLALIVKKRPQSMAELMQIEGVGQAKVKKYGEEILGISKISPQHSSMEVPSDGRLI